MAEPVYHFHNYRVGVLLADGLATSIRFIVDGASGELAFPADRNMLEAEELVLIVPEEQPNDEEELQLLLSARQVDGDATGLKDRWTAYHGPTERALFASCRIEAAKFDGWVVEPAELCTVNSVRRAEGRLLKRANADKARLRSTCSRRASAAVLDPVAVGADQFGIEVRATFGIVRVWYAATAANDADAERLLDLLMGDGP